jgi:transcriptional regulator GlxA family with amidase domain
VNVPYQRNKLKKVVIWAFDHVLASTVTGPLDVFHQAGVLWNFVCEKELSPHFHVSVATTEGQPVRCLGGITIDPRQSIHDVESPDLIVIPGGANIDKAVSRHREAVDWLKTHYEKGCRLASVCSGAFLLAETGLLDGKTATTHWGFTRLFNRMYPKVHLKPKRLITDEGDLFCSGGVYSGVDLSIYLVEKFCGHETAVQCSKAVVHDYIRESQAPYAASLFPKDHKDEKVLEVQEYIEGRYNSGDLGYDRLSEEFCMSRRTLIRRFKAATGDTPLHYLQRLRVEIAKTLLETRLHSFDEIAYQVGYEDTGFFRKVFVQHTGLRPKEYQKRFTMDQWIVDR